MGKVFTSVWKKIDLRVGYIYKLFRITKASLLRESSALAETKKKLLQISKSISLSNF